MPTTTQEKHCFYCVSNTEGIDYRNAQTLQRFMSHFAKIMPRRRTGLCATHQRQLTTAIKRAREMALLPYVRK
jgi:small subunit ribosomal protein S18